MRLESLVCIVLSSEVYVFHFSLSVGSIWPFDACFLLMYFNKVHATNKKLNKGPRSMEAHFHH